MSAYAVGLTSKMANVYTHNRISPSFRLHKDLSTAPTKVTAKLLTCW